jgi:hypothetical protein
LGGHQPGESLHDEIIFVLDLIPDGSIPIGGTKHIDGRKAHGLYLAKTRCRTRTLSVLEVR